METSVPSLNKCVLLVEDDKDIREALVEILEGEGYSVVQATNGQEGLDMLRTMKSHPNLILVDLMMPVKNGVEFLREQSLSAEISNIPALIMSADGRLDERTAGLKPAGFLRKPVEIDALLEAIASHCA
jgi:CheY-like chemotaxis protein